MNPSYQRDSWCGPNKNRKNDADYHRLEEAIREAVKGEFPKEVIHFCDQPPRDTMSCAPPQRPSFDDQILNILKDLPGVDPKKLRKPKISKSAMTNYLSRCSIVRDAITPILFHILERFLKKQNPGDEAEREIFEYLQKVDSETLEAMKSRLRDFKEIPENESQGLFDKEFMDLPLERAIPKERIISAWIREGIKLVSTRMGNSPEPGLVRPWKIPTRTWTGKKEFVDVPEEVPWPWICMVRY